MKGLLNLKSLSDKEIREIIDLAILFKNGFKKEYKGLKMATLFFENSTRTLISFQSAMINLGITPVQINVSTSSVLKGESLYDTVKVIEATGFDGVVIRHTVDEYYKELKNINIPIFNGGDGKSSHPTQILLDLMTIYEEFGYFEGLKVVIVGDIKHSRVAHENIQIMKRLKMKVMISGPNEFIDESADFEDFEESVKSADVIMMLRVQFERHVDKFGYSINEYHEKYGLTVKRVDLMKPNAIIMHPAPFNREVELANEVVECSKSRIFPQMMNGVYVRMAVISKTLDKK